ncbi:MAG: C_GCAxxG_C_C family protein [bacterium]|nr:C_GCAxxG_C_C family protein [bacterium]
MDHDKFIAEKVRHYYHVENIHCTHTTLNILSKLFDHKVNQQVMDAAEGMHGAGLYGAQCGLVEGAMMFIGLYGKSNGLTAEDIGSLCCEFANGFEEKLGSLVCRELRPEGFKPSNPPHLCEPRTNEAIKYAAEFIAEIFTIELK